MNIKESITKIFSQYNRKPDEPVDLARAVGRETLDTPDIYYGTFDDAGEENALISSRSWNLSEFDECDLKNKTDLDLIELMRRASPDVDKVVLDHQDHVNTEPELAPEDPNSPADVAAVDYIREVYQTLEDIGKPVNQIRDRQISNWYFRGASFLEVVLDTDARTTIDIAETNPLSAYYDRKEHPKRGKIWVIGQKENGEFKDMSEDPTIQYTAVNTKETGAPYGIPLMGSALNPLIFKLTLLKDIRQVVRSQAYPLIHVKGDQEKAAASLPDLAPQAQRQSLDNLIKGVAKALKGRAYNEALHSSNLVELEIHSALNRANLGGLDVLINNLEKELFRGLKTYPVLLGSSQSQTEAQTRIQLILWRAHVSSLQFKLIKDWNQRHNVILQARGLPGKVKLLFTQIGTYSKTEESQIISTIQQAVKSFTEARGAALEQGVITLEEYIAEYEALMKQLEDTVDF